MEKDETQDGAKPEPTGNNSGNASNSNQNTTAGGTGGGTTSQPTIPAELQPFINQLIGAARDEGRTAGQTAAQREQERARKEAEEKAMREQSQFKELAERQAADLTRLQGVEAQHNALLEIVTAQLKADLAALPVDLRDLMPSGLTVAQQWEYVRKAQRRPNANNTTDTSTDPPGNGPGPAKKDTPDQQKVVEATRTAVANSGIYTL